MITHLLRVMGYRTRVSPPGPDGGIDIVAHKDELGFEPPIIKVQVKSTEGKVGDPETSALYGKVGTNEHGLLVTLGTFTPQARNFERAKSNLRLIDGELPVCTLMGPPLLQGHGARGDGRNDGGHDGRDGLRRRGLSEAARSARRRRLLQGHGATGRPEGGVWAESGRGSSGSS